MTQIRTFPARATRSSCTPATPFLDVEMPQFVLYKLCKFHPATRHGLGCTWSQMAQCRDHGHRQTNEQTNKRTNRQTHPRQIKQTTLPYSVGGRLTQGRRREVLFEGDGFMGTETNLPPKLMFSSDFSHFILEMLDYAKFYTRCIKKRSCWNSIISGGTSPRWFLDCGGRVHRPPAFGAHGLTHGTKIRFRLYSSKSAKNADRKNRR